MALKRRAIEFASAESRQKAIEQGSLAYLDRTIVISELENVEMLDRFAIRREKKIKRHQKVRDEKNAQKKQAYIEKKRAKMQRHREHMAAKRAAEGEKKEEEAAEDAKPSRGGFLGGKGGRGGMRGGRGGMRGGRGGMIWYSVRFNT